MKLVQADLYSWASLAGIAVSGAVALIVSVVVMSQGYGAILPHLYYIPIVIATYFYSRRGFIFSVVLTAIYLSLAIFFFYPVDSGQVISAIIRSPIMIAVAFTIAWLSDRGNQMRSSLERTQFAVDTSPDEVYFVRPDGHLGYANMIACTSLGIDSAHVEKTTIFNIQPDMTPSSWKERWDQVSENKRMTRETFHRKANGTIYPVEVSQNYVRVEDEEFSCIYARDITGKKQAEERLKMSEQEKSLILNNVSEWVIYLDADYGIIRANQAVCDYVGKDSDFFVGRHCYDVLHGLSTPCPGCRLSESFQEGVGVQYEMTTPEGRQTEMVVNPVQNSDGTVTGAVALTMDITARKEVEEKIRINEERLRLALDSARMSVWNWDLRDDTITYDQHFGALLGYENGAEKQYIEDIRSHFSSDNIEELFRNLPDGSLEKSGTVETDFRIKCADKSWRWIHAAGRPVEYDETGKVVRVTGIFMDITDLRNSHDSLERTNRKLSLLSGVTRHDVMNQIMGILLLKDYVLDRCVVNGCNVKEDLDMIFSAVETIQRQMEFARDYQDLGLKTPEWQNIKKLIRSILIAHSLGALNLDADVDNLEIYADQLFEKVLYNLIDNSLRHGKTVSEIRLHFEEHGDYGKLIYEDDGEGIPESLKEAVFERGFGSNSGFGLFLIREILEVTDFSVIECGREGEGARFEITIPDGMYRYATIPESLRQK